MNIVIILAIVVGLLFAATYFTRRRYGVLGLALCAGFILSTMWTAEVTPYVHDAGIELMSPPLKSVVSVTLVLLPALILLFSGPTYTKQWQRLIGAAAFSLLATSFLITTLGSGIDLDKQGQAVYDFVVENKNSIITVAIAYALYDVLTHKTPKELKKK